MHFGKLLQRALLTASMLILAGCASQSHLPPVPATFDDYVAQTRADIAANRRFATADLATEIDRMTPFELRPQPPLKADGRAVLFIHGLGDSPWTFRETAERLVKDGIVVRSILIPGHGTKPEDMLAFTGDDWIEAARRELLRLKREGYRVWAAGFSTGGNIAIKLAAETDLEGLILFSPAPYLRTNLIYLVPAASLFIDWLITPEDAAGDTSPVKYRTVPMAGLDAFYDTMRSAQGALNSPKKRLSETPVFLALAEADSVVDTKRVLAEADRVFLNRRSEVFWYGEAKPDVDQIRVVFQEAFLPEKHIRSFSHLCLNFSPENAYYGRNGRAARCASDESPASLRHIRCEIPESDVWYGAWGEKRDGHPYVRLTYNPYFEDQARAILAFMRATDQPAAAESHP